MSEIEEQLKAMIDARAAVGLKKYNVDLMRDDYDLDRWLELAIEEALDQAAYMQRARVMLKSGRKSLPDQSEGELIPWPENEGYRFAVAYVGRYLLFTQFRPVKTDIDDDNGWEWIGPYMVVEGRISDPCAIRERPVNL